jgi:hypothetical protein
LLGAVALTLNNPKNIKPTRAALLLPQSRNDSVESYRRPPLGNNKNPNQKQLGEKQPGTFHCNPGNMSGKTAGIKKDDPQVDKANSPGDTVVKDAG